MRPWVSPAAVPRVRSSTAVESRVVRDLNAWMRAASPWHHDIHVLIPSPLPLPASGFVRNFKPLNVSWGPLSDGSREKARARRVAQYGGDSIDKLRVMAAEQEERDKESRTVYERHRRETVRRQRTQRTWTADDVGAAETS